MYVYVIYVFIFLFLKVVKDIQMLSSLGFSSCIKYTISLVSPLTSPTPGLHF